MKDMSKNWDQYSVQLARAKIYFYEPFERLTLRKIVEDVLSITSTHRIDLFAIFDAVSKRGGFSRMQEQKRWIEVEYSLPYYKCNFRQLYMEHLLKRQLQISEALKSFNKQYKVIQEAFIEVYYIPNSSAGGFYHFQDDENSFCKQNFTYVDLYLNIKSISSVPCSPKRLIIEYADKYLLTRKWLIMKGYSRPFSDEELDSLQILKIYNNNASIALIGWNISNILLAFKLHQLKFNVVLYTNFDKQQDINTLDRMLCVKEGVFILDNGVGGPFSYSELFKQNEIETKQVSNYCGLIDESGRSFPQFRVRQSEQLFLGLLADFKFEESNRKLLYNQVLSLIAKKKLNDESGLIKWHLQRYLMLNNFHGQDTTVSLHHNYLHRRKHKIFMSRKRPIYIKSCIKLVQRAIKSFKVIHTKPKSIDFCNNMWLIQQRPNERRSFSSLVYSDSQQIFDMISKRNYKIPSMENQNLTILRELSANTWINCSFRFKEKLKLKNDLLTQLLKRKKDFHKICQYNISEENCSFQLKGAYGFYYYFVIEEGTGLIATCKVENFLSHSSTPEELKKSLTCQMLKQFEINLLSYKLPQLEEPEVIEYSHSFYMKDDSLSRDRIIKLKNWQRMYLSIGLPWALNPNKLSSQIDCSNQILALIANVYYHLYKFDEKAKQSFSNQYKNRKTQIAKNQHQIIEKPSIKQSIQQEIQQNSRKISQIKVDTKQISQQKKNTAVMEVQPSMLNQVLYSEKALQQIKIKIQIQLRVNPLQQVIFSPQNKSKIPDLNSDLFGFNHNFIKSTYKFFSQQISTINQSIQQVANAFSNQQQKSKYECLKQKHHQIQSVLNDFQTTFQLVQPYRIQKNTYLHSIGKSYAKFPSTKQILRNLKEIERLIAISRDSGEIIEEQPLYYTIDLFLFDGFMTKSEFYSLQNPYQTNIYIQCLIYIQKQKQNDQIWNNVTPLYVIFQESNLAIFYYHTSLTRLIEKFNNHIQKRRKYLLNNSIFRRRDCNFNLIKDSRKIQMMFEQIKIKISEQIQFQTQGQFFSEDELLDNILQSKLMSEVPQQIFENPSENTLYSKILYPESNQQKTHFLMDSLNLMTRKQLQSYGINSEIALMDIFFGYFSKKYFIFEIFWNKQLQNFSKSLSPSNRSFQQMLSKIKANDPILFKQIQEILNEDKKNVHQDYPSILDFDENSLTVQRKFLASKNEPLKIKIQTNTDAQMQIQLPQQKSTIKRSKETYVVQKQQSMKNYIFIKEFSFKQSQSWDRKGDKQRSRCYLMIGQNGEKLELDHRQDPLELIVSILVDTWDYEDIYENFRNLVKAEIQNCQFNLPQKMALYYQSTRKKSSLLGVQQVSQLRDTLNYRKPKNQSKKAQLSYNTEYCTDEDDRQTLLQHLQSQTMVFADGQIIICKY